MSDRQDTAARQQLHQASEPRPTRQPCLEQAPTIVLVHGAFAESASWSTVIEDLRSRGMEVIAAANPLRSVAGDAAYVRDVLKAIGKPVVLVAHSYGGVVITEAAARNSAVTSLVYVAGFAPDHGESAFSCRRSSPAATRRFGNQLPGLLGRQRARHQTRRLRPPVRRGRARDPGRRDGCHSASGHRGRPDDEPADRRPGLAGHPVLVRLRRPGQDHPGRVAPVYG